MTKRFTLLRGLTAQLPTVVVCLSLICATNAQSINTDPGNKETLSISGVTFSCPKHFNIEREHIDKEFVYMRHDKYDLGLFVVATEKTDVDNDYVHKLANLMSNYLFPQELETFSWKQLGGYEKASKFEIAGGMMQGFNGLQRVFVQYRQLHITGRQVIVGYVFGLGRGDDARQLFERNLGGDSMPGWYAQAHIIASITHERYDQINQPGSRIAARPPGRN
jgi:hypothetical protein